MNLQQLRYVVATAELGTMKVNEEIAALRTMSLDPARQLVLPRCAGLILTQPALTLFSIGAGGLGGLLVSAGYGIGPTAFVHRLTAVLGPDDLLNGLGKAVLFSLIVAFSGAFYGLRVRGGATAVGAATRSAVVVAIALVVVADSIVTGVTVGLM